MRLLQEKVDEDDVLHLTTVEWKASMEVMLGRIGLTLPQLREAAASGEFPSERARMAWRVIAHADGAR